MTRSRWLIIAVVAVVVLLIAGVSLAACDSNNSSNSLGRNAGAISQVTTLYACIKPTNGAVDVGPSGRPIIRAYKPVCPAGSGDIIVHWAVQGSTPPTPSTTRPPTTVPTSTVPVTPPSTSPPTTPTTVPGNVPNTPPAATGYFQTAAPGTPFKTDAQCAALVHRSTWEPRPQNNTPNHVVPPQPNTLGNFSQWNAAWNSTYKSRISGNFTGTTDEIFQWAACKWGWSDNVIRAEAISESNWNEGTLNNGVPVANQGFGDYSSNAADCPYLFPNTPCPTSYGILQAKWLFHPAIKPSNSPQQAFPWTTKSTAFAVDEQVAEMRGCYDGMSTYLGNTKGDLLGCLQSWFSGSWTAGGGSYAQGVQSNLNNKQWLTWANATRTSHDVPVAGLPKGYVGP